MLNLLVYWYGTLVAAILLVVVFVRSWKDATQRSQFMREAGCEPIKSKAPLRDPYFGLDFIFDLIFKKASDSCIAEAHDSFRQLGVTYTSKRWAWETIYTCESLNIKHILATNSADFELPWIRVAAISSFLGCGIFTLSGHSWSHSRAALKPSLTKANMISLTPLLEEHFQALLQIIPEDGAKIDLQPLFFALTMDIATDFLLNNSTHMLKSTRDHGAKEQYLRDYAICSEAASKNMQMGPLQTFAIRPRASQAKHRVFNFMDEYVDECVRQRQAGKLLVRYDLLQEMQGANMGSKDIRDQILHILLASRDTTASLLSNLFFLLAKEPAIYAKLRGDVLEILGKEPPTTEQLRDVEYLKWCIQESLRLHPPIPSNARVALRDTTLPRGGGRDGTGPVFVSKGTVIVYNVYSMHRDETIYGKDVEVFRPERWKGLRPGWAYLPFNGGPRICLGQHFAMQEVTYLVARFVQTFETIRSMDERPWLETYALAMTCKNGVLCTLSRNSAPRDESIL
ncbi:Cytochrome P450 monooxygenase fsdH [Paramyrothecium foliicola]|nr:Cytochrome P450 monooxygenase fsdH [Paramyrothecium foliicola]